MGLGKVEDAWTKCLQQGRCVKSILEMGKMYYGRLWIWKRPDVLAFVDLDRSAWYLADAKSVCSCRKIVEISAVFLCR